MTSLEHVFKELCYGTLRMEETSQKDLAILIAWSSATGDITYLICHVTSQEHEIEGSCNFLSESLLLYFITLPSLVVSSIVVVELFFISHVILQDRVIKRSCEFMDRRTSR